MGELKKKNKCRIIVTSLNAMTCDVFNILGFVDPKLFVYIKVKLSLTYQIWPGHFFGTLCIASHQNRDHYSKKNSVEAAKILMFIDFFIDHSSDTFTKKN